MKKKVFLCEDIHQKAYERLACHFEIISDINNITDAEAIIVRNMYIDKMLIDQCQCLKILAVHGTGYDGIDLKYLKEKNITVFNVPAENALSVAELVVALILNVSRKIYLADRLLQSNQIIETGSALFAGSEISYKTLGLIGCGNTAQKTAYILQNGFNMKVIAYSPSLTLEKAKELNIEKYHSIKEVFEKADIVSIHCALNEQTKGMINLKILKHAKKECILINTARGAIIDEHDLYIALKEKIIQGAACDVFVEEPLHPNNPLLKLDNFIATCHIGATTDEALYRVGMKVVEGIINFFHNQEIPNRL